MVRAEGWTEYWLINSLGQHTLLTNLMLGERQDTKEFLRDPEFFLEELLRLEALGELVLEAFLDDPRLFGLLSVDIS